MSTNASPLDAIYHSIVTSTAMTPKKNSLNNNQTSQAIADSIRYTLSVWAATAARKQCVATAMTAGINVVEARFPVSSMVMENLGREGQFRHPRRVISFSLFGRRPLYVRGALANARLARALYPCWTCRFYCATDVDPAILGDLVEAGSQVVVFKALPERGGREGGSASPLAHSAER